jgi:hypothetical protein
MCICRVQHQKLTMYTFVLIQYHWTPNLPLINFGSNRDHPSNWKQLWIQTSHGFQLQLWGPLVGAMFFFPFPGCHGSGVQGESEGPGWLMISWQVGGLYPIEWGISWSKNGASLSFEFRVLCPNLVGHIHRIGPWKKRNPRNFGPLWVVDVVEEIRYFT